MECINNFTMGQLLLLCIVVGCIAEPPKFHQGLSPEDLHRYFGTQVREHVPTYEVVSPVLKKSIQHRPWSAEGKPPQQYDLNVFGEKLKLHLEHNHRLMAPGCLVHHLGFNGTKRIQPCPSQQEDCYYHGTSLAHNGSQAALSTCHGLHGMIRLLDRDFDLWIQPIDKRHVARAKRSVTSPLDHPHIVFKRATGQGHSHCATQDDVDVDAMASQAMTSSRVRRSLGGKFAEMLLVADKTMHEQHKDRLKAYLLTVANVASRILLDESLETPVHFTVVKIQILEADQPGLTITGDAEASKDSFCNWQEKTNAQDDSSPQHHDGAALFTRQDIVYLGNRDTTGLATVGGMCELNRRCSINEDNGLGVGLTLAHETGHTLGMTHDGAGNDCANGKNVMSSSGGGGHTAMMWSRCSKEAFARYLQGTKSSCLNDDPQTSVALPRDLPGLLYNGDDQCELYLGPGSTLCDGMQLNQGDECMHLACHDPHNPGMCNADSVPRLDGTMCGNRRYCIRGTCVDIGPNGPQPRDGGWSSWDSEWTACSRSCGGGVRTRRRKCDNPKPILGGKECPGEKVMAELCNIQACSSSEEAFRQNQCSQTDSIPYNGQLKHWVPVNLLDERQCQLHCRVSGQRLELLRHINGRTWYLDGTTCFEEAASFARCIDGQCREFGCDGKTGSQYRYDSCGVCGGQGDTCKKLTGTYNQGREKEYVTFLTIPKGSSSIKVTNDNKFTQMSVKIGGERVFSKVGGSADPSGVYTANSIPVNYKSPSSITETIAIEGPIPQPVEAQVWRKFSDSAFQGVAPQIKYEYFVPTGNSQTSDYAWKVRNGQCSKTCGGGVYEQIVTCARQASGAEVDAHFCDVRQKPSLIGAACNNQACPPRWRAGSFGDCSKTCGGGTQSREVECVQAGGGVEQVVGVASCPANGKPVTSRRCNDRACPAQWLPGDWSACSLTCGKGLRTRGVICVKDLISKQEVMESGCQAANKPATQETCTNSVCFPDITGSACADSDNSCSGYKEDMCQQFPDFAAKSCMKTCSFCSPEGGKCKDKSSDCAGYGTTVCSGDYAEWAAANCAKMCGFCGQESCTDESGDCASYGASICTGDYAEWAASKCAKFCGVCGGGGGEGTDVKQAAASTTQGVPTTAQPTTTTTTTTNPPSTATRSANPSHDPNPDLYPGCVDTINCAAFESSFCTDASYASLAREKCPRYCHLCGQQHTTESEQDRCQDESPSCSQYGQSICDNQTYKDWVRINCRKFCHLCNQGSVGATTVPTRNDELRTSTVGKKDSGACSDQINNCQQYGRQYCTMPEYAAWAKTNCAAFCNFCGTEGQSSAASTFTTTTATSAPTTVMETMKDSTTTASTSKKAELSSARSAECKDVVSNCHDYSPEFCTMPAYSAWARENCPAFCNLCDGKQTSTTKATSTAVTTTTAAATTTAATTTTATTLTSSTPTSPRVTTTTAQQSQRGAQCVDKIDNCARYGVTFCSDTQYSAWAQENCARFCHFCQAAEGTEEVCQDKMENCHLYEDACSNTDYTDWVALNCPKFCGVCGEKTLSSSLATLPTSPTTTLRTTKIPSTTTPSTTKQSTTAVDADCRDKEDNCASFGASFCTNKDYADFAKDRCARYCRFCGAQTQTVDTEECADKADNCDRYDKGVCHNSEYKEWSRINCAKYCGFCGGQGGGTATGATTDSCEDKNSDCAGYGESVCTGQYADWAKDNCPKMCGQCGATTTNNNNNNNNNNIKDNSDSCQDKADTCAAYGHSVCTGTYAEWAKDNCQKLCGLCTSQVTSSAANSCVDVNSDCQAYGASVCETYADWAAQNCQKLCGLCGSRRKRSVLLPPSPPPLPPLCNKVLSEPRGSVSLIGQPLATPCTQVIVGPVGSVVHLSFTALRISCQQGDWLEVTEHGARKKSKHEPRDLCQLHAPVHWTSAGHVVTVKLTTATPGHGYNLTYSIQKTPVTGYSCDEVLTNPSGVLSTPASTLSREQSLPPSGLCSTTIVAPPTYTVRLDFNAFRLDSPDCSKDSVTVYDLEYKSKDVFCGFLSDFAWHSKGSQVKVIFVTSAKSSSPGFLASYKFIAP